MATLTFEGLNDLVKGTLRHLGRAKFQQIGQSLTDYYIFRQCFKKDRVTFDSGIGIQRTLMNRLSSQAAHVGLLDTDASDIPDLLVQMNIPWVHAKTQWSYLYQEGLVNRGEALVTRVIEPRRADAMISLAEEIENKAWSCPAMANTVDPYGIPYWVVKASSDTEGFNGGLPSDHTTVAGVNLTTTPTFKNYNGQYVAVSKGDLIKKMRTAQRKTRFMSPIEDKDYTQGVGKNLRIYVNEATASDFEDVGEAQNENLGRDLAPMTVKANDVKSNDGVLTFRRHPIIYVPKLDADTSNPVYMLDHATFMPVALKGNWMRETGPVPNPLNHNGMRVFIDITYNYLMLDRRRNSVFSKAA